MKKKQKKSLPVSVMTIIALVICGIAVCLFAPMSTSDETSYLYVDDDDDLDSISAKMDTLCHGYGVAGTMMLAKCTGYGSHIRSGRYPISNATGSLLFFRRMRNGQQEPVHLTIKSVRTLERLAEDVSQKMMMSKEDLMSYLTENDSCAIFDCDTATIACMFIPNTYEIYWNTSVEGFLKRMQKESKAFWNDERTKKAKELGLSATEVVTMASIIDEETANNGEKPMVAGMYYNRLQQKMPLQADPTIKFAMKNFEAKRIYRKWLTYDSPYNTYIHIGLPPGPIRIPSVAGIDAVLNLVHHDYTYMCAKEDFSGTHNFARTYAEHLQNAAKYTKALNDRGIK